jgi:hypothetical protein
VLSSRLLKGHRVVDGRQSRGGVGCSCSEGKRGKRGGSTMPEADDTVNSGAAAAGEAEGGGWHLEVEDDQSKLGWWAECAVGLNY